MSLCHLLQLKDYLYSKYNNYLLLVLLCRLTVCFCCTELSSVFLLASLSFWHFPTERFFLRRATSFSQLKTNGLYANSWLWNECSEVFEHLHALSRSQKDNLQQLNDNDLIPLDICRGGGGNAAIVSNTLARTQKGVTAVIQCC